MIRGSCYGWEIDSPLEFEFLRDLPGDSKLHVDEWTPGEAPASNGELLVRWRPRPDRPFHGSVHKLDEDTLVVLTSDAGWFRIHLGDHIVEIPRGVHPVDREVRLWTTPMLLLNTIIGRTPLHAACVQVDGKSIALAGPGGSGKTTLASAMAARGHGLVSEDVTVVDGLLNVIPGPDLLRLRPPAMGNRPISHRSDIVRQTDDRTFVRTSSPVDGATSLHAIVLLKSAGDSQLTARHDPQRIADLWQLSFHLPNLTDRERAFDAVTTLADRIPIFDLSRPLDWKSLEWSADQIEELVR